MEKWQFLRRATITNQDHLPDSFKEKECWKNDIYTVFVNRGILASDGVTKVTWLSLKRNDKEPITDWRHKQWIKNQLVGEQNEGCELYPAEERLIDTSNQYHIYVFEDPTIRFPFGFIGGRGISRTPLPGGKQRNFPKNMVPADIDEMEKGINQAKKTYLS